MRRLLVRQSLPATTVGIVATVTGQGFDGRRRGRVEHIRRLRLLGLRRLLRVTVAFLKDIPAFTFNGKTRI